MSTFGDDATGRSGPLVQPIGPPHTSPWLIYAAILPCVAVVMSIIRPSDGSWRVVVAVGSVIVAGAGGIRASRLARRMPPRSAREAQRRWLTAVGVTLALAIVVHTYDPALRPLRGPVGMIWLALMFAAVGPRSKSPSSAAKRWQALFHATQLFLIIGLVDYLADDTSHLRGHATTYATVAAWCLLSIFVSGLRRSDVARAPIRTPADGES